MNPAAALSEADRRDRIARLPDTVAAQIAAGEVIERPASVVKELLENACDAGAGRISVTVTEAGLGRIVVSDDGAGIAADQLALAFTRYATSKLRALEDLERLRSYGFRGEALPSIVAAAEVECVSRPAGAVAGARIRFAGGRCLGQTPCGAPPGTRLEVRALFERQPARRKFLATPRAERAAIARVCSEAVLARPGLALRLEIDGRTPLQSEGLGETPAGRRAAFAAVWGDAIAEAALAFAGQRGALRVEGLAAPPGQHRGRRGGVQIVINGRPVQSRRLTYAVEGAYAELLPSRRFPIAAVFLELPPDQLDVNVHPAKATVKLRDEAAAFGLIQRTLREALLAGRSLGPAGLTGPDGWAGAALGEAGAGAGPATQDRSAAAGIAAGGRGLAPARAEPGATAPLPSLPLLRVVGQLRQTLIVAEGPAGLALIDQHAAHERVLYERLLAKTDDEGARRLLLDPPLVELTPVQAAALAEHETGLAAAGFVVEPFGQRALRLRAVPACLEGPLRDPRAPEVALLELLDALLDPVPGNGAGTGVGDEAEPRRFDLVAASAACHAAVRAGRTLAAEEMRALLRDLEACDNPQTCPHGRPTLVELPADELLRRFGR